MCFWFLAADDEINLNSQSNNRMMPKPAGATDCCFLKSGYRRMATHDSDISEYQE
jgi:hypothetical protein